MFKSLSHRRVFQGALAVGAAAVTTVAMALPTGAESWASATVQFHNASCGFPIQNAMPIGSAKFHRLGTKVTVDFLLTNGTPSTAYSIQLWKFTGGITTCSAIVTLGTLTTNAWGGGELIASTATPITKLFATAQDPTLVFNDSLAVSLP
jgi:hypothetical protein